MSRRPFLQFVPALIAVACATPDKPAPTAPDKLDDLTPVAAISDARSGGESHFYWLPPIASAITYPGTFDAAASPELRICPFANNVCTAPATVYTRTSSPPIAVSASAQSYSLDWSTKPADITVGDYRAEVRLAGRLLGFADVRVVGNAKDLKTVPAGFAGVQDGKSLMYAFRIENGIVGSVTITPRDSSLSIGDSRLFSATVRDIHGATLGGAAVAWTSRIPSIATISASGLATGVATGITTIVATSGGVLDSTSLTVGPIPVARVVVSPAGVIALSLGQQRPFTAATLDAGGHVLAGRTVIWTTNDASIVTIGPDGLATATGPGVSFIVAASEGKRDSTFVDVTSGATVTCLRPWTLPEIWFAPNVYGRQVTGRYGAIFGSVQPTASSGEYYPLQLEGTSSSLYTNNIIGCSTGPVTLGDSVTLSVGNLVGPTITGLDSLFTRDPNATWDPSANGGLGGIVGSNAPVGGESARVVQVALYIPNGQVGVSRVAVQRTAFVFVESYVKVAGTPPGSLRADITFRFLRFGP